MNPQTLKLNQLTKNIIEHKKINSFMPVQIKAFNNGLMEGKNLLVCSPTGSGKTLVAEIAIIEGLVKDKYTNKAIYIVPMKALATEKYDNFMKYYSEFFKITVLTGDSEEAERELSSIDKSDIIIVTSEKLDSILRHNHSWIKNVKVLVIDEIHLINDFNRGPTLEIVITLIKHLNTEIQIIGLSATIGNSNELAEWLGANLIIDDYRPVALKKGVIFDGKLEFVN